MRVRIQPLNKLNHLRPNNALHLTPPLPVPLRAWLAVQAVPPVSAPVGPLESGGAWPKEARQIHKPLPRHRVLL